ncbi:MAG TPA: hypothetical protein VJB98_00745 [Candidatus Paceibacterota bacterium]
MILTHKKWGIFKSVRVLYQGEALKFSKWDYVTVISYSPLPLEKEGFSLTTKNIANIYLDGTDEEILGRFSRNTRNEILRTIQDSPLRQGFAGQVRFTIHEEYRKEIYELYKEFETSQGRAPWREETLRSGIIHFNAYYKDELISSIPCYDLKPVLQVRAMFSKRLSTHDHEFNKIISNANRRLVYEVCKWARAREYKFVGLGAVTTSTEQKANVAQFKMFFNPKVETEYTYTRRPWFML